MSVGLKELKTTMRNMSNTPFKYTVFSCKSLRIAQIFKIWSVLSAMQVFLSYHELITVYLCVIAMVFYDVQF